MIRTFYRILVATLALGAGVALSQSVALADVTLTFTGYGDVTSQNALKICGLL